MNWRKLRYLYYSVRFNFHYLPIKQALKLPILFYNKGEFSSMKGTVKIKGTVKHGMIVIGIPNNPIYPKNSKFIWHNLGGECIFSSGIGFQQGSAIRIGRSGRLEFGNDIAIGPNCKIICFNNIKFGNHFRMGWDILIMDTDFHYTYNLEKCRTSTLTKPILLDDNCWIGVRSIIYKGTILPKYTIVGANTVLNKNYDCEPFSLLVGSPARVKKMGVCRLLDDNISQSEIMEVENKYKRFLENREKTKEII